MGRFPKEALLVCKRIWYFFDVITLHDIVATVKRARPALLSGSMGLAEQSDPESRSVSDITIYVTYIRIL